MRYFRYFHPLAAKNRRGKIDRNSVKLRVVPCAYRTRGARLSPLIRAVRRLSLRTLKRSNPKR